MIEPLAKKADSRGTLVAFDIKDLVFEPKRFFYVKNVPKLECRGNHAHFNTQQYLVCLKGKIEVTLFDGISEKTFFLEENQMIFVDKMIWDSQVYITGEEVLLSLCSTEYDPADYITDIAEFTKLKQNLQS